MSDHHVVDPGDDGVIDLDLVDVGTPKRFRLAGRDFTLPAALPLALGMAAKNQDLDAMALLLASGDRDLADHLMAHLTEPHIDAITAQYSQPG